MHPTLADHVMDLVHNAFEAGATWVMVDWADAGDRIEVSVADNGRGMTAATVERALNPFFTEPGKHPSRRVGLGLPFLRQAVEQTGGRLDLKSRPGEGTSVWFDVPARHLDVPPAGDVAGAIVALMAMAGAGRELVVRRARAGAVYQVSRRELHDALDGLECAGALALARQYVTACEQNLADSAPAGSVVQTALPADKGR